MFGEMRYDEQTDKGVIVQRTRVNRVALSLALNKSELIKVCDFT